MQRTRGVIRFVRSPVGVIARARPINRRASCVVFKTNSTRFIKTVLGFARFGFVKKKYARSIFYCAFVFIVMCVRRTAANRPSPSGRSVKKLNGNNNNERADPVTFSRQRAARPDTFNHGLIPRSETRYCESIETSSCAVDD